MGILSDRLTSIEPWLHDSPDDQISADASPETGALNTATTSAFLDWRWAMPPMRAAVPLPSQAVDQPSFDALHASERWGEEDTYLLSEFDGFLIDRQTAAAACGALGARIAA